MLPVRLAPAKGVAIPNPAAGGRKSASRSASRTIAAGIAISAAFASLIFMRRRRAVALAGLLLAVGAVVFSVTTAEANVPPPFKSPPDPAPSPVLQTDPLTFAELIRNWSEKKLSEGDGQVKVIYSDTVDSITLMLPQGFDKPAAQEPEKPKSPRPLPKPEFKSQ